MKVLVTLIAFVLFVTVATQASATQRDRIAQDTRTADAAMKRLAKSVYGYVERTGRCYRTTVLRETNGPRTKATVCRYYFAHRDKSGALVECPTARVIFKDGLPREYRSGECPTS